MVIIISIRTVIIIIIIIIIRIIIIMIIIIIIMSTRVLVTFYIERGIYQQNHSTEKSQYNLAILQLWKLIINYIFSYTLYVIIHWVT